MADLPVCLAMDRDPEVTRFVAGPWDDPACHEAFVRERIEADFGVGLGYWSVFDRHEGFGFLGWVLLIPRDGKGPDIEIGWRFIRRAWGRGHATEAALPVVSHAFGALELERIVADITPGNEGSMNVARKIGMVRADVVGHDPGSDILFVMTRAMYETGSRRGMVQPVSRTSVFLRRSV